MKNKYNMTKEDNIFFAKRKLIDNLYKSANLVANKEMIRNGMGIIAVPVEKIGKYFTELIKFYETNDYTNIKKWIYENCIDGVD